VNLNQRPYKIKVAYTTDGINWAFVDDGSEFHAICTDTDESVVTYFSKPVVASEIRIYPTPAEPNGYPSMRFEVYYKKDCEVPAVATGSNVYASSIHPDCSTTNAYLNAKQKSNKVDPWVGGWCPNNRDEKDPWIGVNLGNEPKLVTAFET